MNDAVYELQGYLRSISQYDKDIPYTPSDGIFGEETAAAVRAFQRKNSLEETGTVDFELWEKIREKSDEAAFFFSPPLQIAPAKNSDFPLKKGKESHLNKNINLMLSHLSGFYSNFRELPLTDEFTEETENQIKIFQKIIGREPDGQVDKDTWNRLGWLYGNYACGINAECRTQNGGERFCKRKIAPAEYIS